MPSHPKFPPSAEIKRVLAAVAKTGIDIGTIEIQFDKITIHPRNPEDATGLSGYDLWKLSQGQNTDRVKLVEKESDALLKKPKS